MSECVYVCVGSLDYDRGLNINEQFINITYKK